MGAGAAGRVGESARTGGEGLRRGLAALVPLEEQRQPLVVGAPEPQLLSGVAADDRDLSLRLGSEVVRGRPLTVEERERIAEERAEAATRRARGG